MLTVHTYAHHIKSFDFFNHRSMIACVYCIYEFIAYTSTYLKLKHCRYFQNINCHQSFMTTFLHS